MADETSPVFRWGGKKEQTPPATPPAAPESTGVFRWGGKKQEQPTPPETPVGPPATAEEPSKPGTWYNRPLSKTLTGTSAGDLYDKAVKNLLPQSFQKEKGGTWMGRFAAELGKGGPEVLDFVQSPIGAALVAAHAFPATAPFAAIVDVGIGGQGLFQSYPQFKQALSDGTPESWAEAVKGLAFSLGMVKGGGKTLLSRSLQFRMDPLEVREQTRADITHQTPQAKALAEIATKHKNVDTRTVVEVASKPLSEVEADHKKALIRYQTLKERITEKAKSEKREMTPVEKKVIRNAAAPVRFLGDMKKAMLPAKVEALESQRAATNPNWAQRLYSNAFLREPAKWAGVTKPKFMQISADLVFDRRVFVNKRNLDVNHMIYDLKKLIPAEEQDIRKLGYVMQGTATPDEVGLSQAARDGLQVLKDFGDAQEDLLREAYGKELPLEDALVHLSQIWDLEGVDQATKVHAARTLMNDPFLKKKKISSYQYGIEELHLKPKFNNVLDIMKIRADFATKAIANRRLAGWLRDMGAIISEPEYHAIRPQRLVREGEQPLNAGGNPFGSASGRKVTDWRPAVDATALYRAAYSDKPLEPGMMNKPVYVHPDYADAVNAVFGKGWDNPVINRLETIRAFGKKTALTGSLFHNFALSEQAHAIHVLRSNPIKTLSKTFLFNPEWLRGVKSTVWEAIGREGDAPPVMRNYEIASDAVENGMDLNSEEQEHWVFQKVKEMAESNSKISRALGKAMKPGAALLKGADRALWDFYHQGSMLSSYETIVGDELRNLGPNATETQIREVKRAAAEHVNNAYGAMNFEKMLVSPKVRQSLNWLLLAPSWTFSNIRVLTTGYESAAGVRLTNQYVRGAAISWFLSTQAMNFALTGWYSRNDPDGPKPRLTYDNVGNPVTMGGKALPGVNENSYNIYAGKNADGSDRFIVLGKGFREVFRVVLDPWNYFWGKTSLPVKTAFTLAGGASPGSGFPEIDKKASTGDQLAQATSTVLSGAGLPFVAEGLAKEGLHAAFPEAVNKPQASSQFMSLPTKKGSSFQRAEEMYRDFLNAGDVDSANQVLAVAAHNGIDPRKIRATYKVDERKRQRRANQ